MISLMAVLPAAGPGVLTDFATYSGFSSGDQIGKTLKAIIIAITAIWIIWANVAEIRAWSKEQSDSLSLLSILIRGSVIFAFVGLILGVLS